MIKEHWTLLWDLKKTGTAELQVCGAFARHSGMAIAGFAMFRTVFLNYDFP